MQATPLIQTKLQPPRLSNDLLHRSRLMRRMNNGVRRKLTLVSAPAGCGKSTLVAAWLQQTDMPVAWVSLDRNDNDLVTFLHYLIAAVETASDDQSQSTPFTTTKALLRAPTLPEVVSFVAAFVNDLSGLKEMAVIVLDDFHLIQDAHVIQFLNILLDHLPRQAHLILACRVDPDLPISRLRVQHELTEFRMQDLKFSSHESQEYLRRVVDPEFDREAASILSERTEGWIAGLRLAAISLQSQHRKDFLDFSRAFNGNHDHVMTYLADEVLGQQSERVRRFLMQTSIMDRFCVPLCMALTEYPEMECKEILAWLEAKNLFIVQLDDEHYWYRYHHLFQDLLRHSLRIQMEAAAIQAVHLRASRWLAEYGYVEEALHHALADEAPLEAARLIEQNVHDRLDSGDWRTLERWLSLLPAATVEERPALVLAHAWVLHNQYQLLPLPPLLQRATTLLASKECSLDEAARQALAGEIAVLTSFVHLIHNEHEHMLSQAQLALEWLPPQNHYARGYTMLVYGLASSMMGQGGNAVRLLKVQLNECPADSPDFVARLLETLEFIHMQSGRLHTVVETSKRRLQLAQSANLPIDNGWANLVLGVVHYEWNDLEAAEQYFAEAARFRHSVHSRVYHDSMIGLSLIQLAKGNQQKALEIAENLLEVMTETRNELLLLEIRAFRARIALHADDMDAAVRWLETTEPEPIVWAFTIYHPPIFNRARILLAQRTRASLTHAISLLESALQEAIRLHNVNLRIELSVVDP